MTGMTIGVRITHIKDNKKEKICSGKFLHFDRIPKTQTLMVTNSSRQSMYSHHCSFKNISQRIKCFFLITNKYGIICLLYYDNYIQNLAFIPKTKQLIIQRYFCFHTDWCFPLCRMNCSCHTVLKTVLSVFFLCVFFYQYFLIWCNAYFKFLETFIHIEVLVYIFIKLNILYIRWICKYLNLLKPVQVILKKSNKNQR